MPSDVSSRETSPVFVEAAVHTASHTGRLRVTSSEPAVSSQGHGRLGRQSAARDSETGDDTVRSMPEVPKYSAARKDTRHQPPIARK